MEEEILALAIAMGHVGTQEEDVLRTLCRAAETELTGRLRPGLAPGDCADAFVLGAAFLALAGLAAEGGGATRLTAGSLTIEERGGGAGKSAGLRQQGELVMAPYLRDGTFLFRGVRG